jgi:transposase
MKRQAVNNPKAKKKRHMSLLETLKSSHDWNFKRFGNLLTRHLLFALKQLPAKKDLIQQVFKNLLIVVLLIKKSRKFREKFSCKPQFVQKSKWSTFLDKLSISDDQSTLTMILLQTLLQELTSKEGVYQPFWTPAYKTLSETLLLPSKTDSVDLSNDWSQKQDALSPFLTKTTTSQTNFNKASSQLSKSFVVEIWEKEILEKTKLKTLKIKLYLQESQKKIINEFIDTSRYVYNKTLEYLKKGHSNNFFNLRDLLVTYETKKGNVFVKEYDSRIKELNNRLRECTELESDIYKEQLKLLKKEKAEKMKQVDSEKNPLVKEFELRTPQTIRAYAVKQCCDAMKSGMSNLQNGNIKYFNMKYRKKSSRQQGVELEPDQISLKDGTFRILPQFFGDNCYLKIHNRMKKKLLKNDTKIKHNVEIIRNNNNEYWLYLVIPTVIKDKKRNPDRVAGIDLGVRTFATVFSNTLQDESMRETKVYEYNHRMDLLKKLNDKLDLLKSLKKVQRRKMCKLEQRKKNLVDSLHWDFINDILENNDIILLGLIKSHNIVKGGHNRKLNRDFCDLKFFLQRQRLFYKASVYQKKVILVKEHYTTKTCSNCGTLNQKIGSSKIFECASCKMVADRDINASNFLKNFAKRHYKSSLVRGD